jgi:thiol-disulfide isomerase/thioredoxin
LAIFLTFRCSSQAGSTIATSGDSGVEAKVQEKTIKAPTFTLTDLSGKLFSLAAQKGKVVFIDFWATWCPPCVMSIPEVEKMVEEYNGKNLVVISISLDTSAVPVKRFMQTHKMTNRVALAGDSGVDSVYGVQGIPAYVIVDQDGNVARGWEGYNPIMTQQWRKEINRLLKL